MKLKTLLIALGLLLTVPAFAQDKGYETDPATVDAIRAAAEQFASAAESVRLALEPAAPAPQRVPAAPSK
jgi:hypothetical protein